MKHGSLFSGYGGLDQAIADVFGAETAWVSDVDPGANLILAHRYPHAPNLGDITAVDWATVEPVDIISGGSPCQDLSHAGRRAGMKPGTRSGLWESLREAIAVLRPTWVVWENVAGALSAYASSEEDTRGEAGDLERGPGRVGDGSGRPALRALGRVLGDLASLGYDAQWHGLRAADIGACHGRWRVFVLAHAQEQRHERGGIAWDGGPGPADGRGGSVSLLPTPRATRGGSNTETCALLPTPRATDGTKGGPNQRGSSGDLMLPSAVVQLLPTPTATPYGSNQSVSPNAAVRPSLDVLARHGMGMPLTIAVQLLPTPTTTQRGTDANLDTREGARANLHNEVAKLLPTPTTEPMTGNGHARNLGREVTRWGDYAQAIARHERAFGHPAPAPTEPGPKGNPRLSARFVEWMMMLPAGWVTDCGITRNQALKALGNGVVPLQAEHALRVMLARTEASA